MIEVFCNHCGEAFQEYKSRIERGRGKFCSKDCMYAGADTRQEFVCDGCGVVDTRQKTRLNRHENNFCSAECSQEFHQQENHPMWDGGSEKFTHTPEGKEWRTSVFKRDDYTCQDCGSSGANTYLNAHHIKPREEYPELEADVDNGITLCTDCHAGRHDEPVSSLILSQKT